MQFGNIITPLDYKLSDLAQNKIGNLTFMFASDKEIILDNTEKDNFLSITEDASFFRFWELSVQKAVLNKLPDYNIFTCMFFEFSLFKKVIFSIPNHIKLLIDNDNNVLLERDEMNRLTDYEMFIDFRP